MMTVVARSLVMMMTIRMVVIIIIWETIERDPVRTGLGLTKKDTAVEMCTRVGLVITDTALGPVEEGVEAEEEDVGGEVIVAERVGQEEREVMMMCLSSVTQLMEASLMVVETGPPAKTNKGTVLLQLMVSQWVYTQGQL